MALENKTGDMTPFDLKKKPIKQYPFLMPLVWGASYLMTRQFHLKIQKVNMKGIKPPFLVLSTHQGFTDYYIGPLAMFPHRAMYVSDMEGFAAFGEWLYRGIGCIGKRRYVPDISVLVNMKYALSLGQSVVLYPESRHSDVGTTAYIPKNMGKLAKFLGVPVVTISAKGCYLANPFWDEEVTRKVPIRVKMECICDKEMLRKINVNALQERIEQELTYDEYEYQHKEGFLIKDSNRAKGLERALYQCRNCKTIGSMRTEKTTICCKACNASFHLTEDGWLEDAKGVRQTIPSWYEWQKKLTIEELKESPQFMEQFDVTIEALPNEKGFVALGEGRLLVQQDAFRLRFKDVSLQEQVLTFPHDRRESVQTEYNYRGRGPCIVLSTQDCCYYIYCNNPAFQPTRLQYMGEYWYGNSDKGRGKNGK